MQINVSWSDLKAFAEQRSVSVQWIIANDRYNLAAIDGAMELTAQIPIVESPENGSDQKDFEDNFKPKGNMSPNSLVTTQFEVNDKDLKLAKCKGNVDPDTKQALVYIQVPGTFGVDDGRWVAGGYAVVDTFDFDDYYKVYIEDKDRKIAWAMALGADPTATAPLSDETIQGMGVLPGIGEAFPNYPVVKSYTDDDLSEENQGWYTDPIAMGSSLDPVGYCEIEPIAGYGHCPAGFYIKLVLVRQNKTTGTMRASLWWGKRE